MKAIVAEKYGLPDYLQLKEVKKPVPKDNEVLIRIHTAKVTRGDVFLQSLSLRIMIGLKRKKYQAMNFREKLNLAVKMYDILKQVTGSSAPHQD